MNNELHVVLVQFRPDKITQDHEQLCVKEAAQIKEGILQVVNTLEKRFSEQLTEDLLHSADAFILGGSGDYLISQNDIPEVLKVLQPFLQKIREKGIPLLGICFGSQILAQAFGGKVVLDASR